jgi:hypothetical protein
VKAAETLVRVSNFTIFFALFNVKFGIKIILMVRTELYINDIISGYIERKIAMRTTYQITKEKYKRTNELASN